VAAKLGARVILGINFEADSPTVEPDYYGLAMFAQAAPAGSRLLNVSSTGSRQLRAWWPGAVALLTVPDR
jgi:hypothetical protein